METTTTTFGITEEQVATLENLAEIYVTDESWVVFASDEGNGIFWVNFAHPFDGDFEYIINADGTWI